MINDPYIRPQTKWYRGPVRGSNPTYGQGICDMFCPRCGGTDIWNGPEDNGYTCRRCGKHFLIAHDINYDAEYDVYDNGGIVHESVPRTELKDRAWGAMLNEMDLGDTYYNNARDYYGPIYTELETDEAALDPASVEYRNRLDTDIPYIELQYAVDGGLADSIRVGERLNIPGTTLAIKRTKNRKTRRGKSLR